MLAAKSGCYPNIDEAHIVSFCKENGLIDSEFTEEDLKDIYYAANVEYAEDEDDNNPDHLLNRKEFFELFLRISVAKFTVLKTDGITRASEGF